jgi:O-antigen/teichoic acid export membrane protein
MPNLISRKIKNGFLLTRGISSLLALVFSLYYSKLLGIEKRSLVTLMLVVIVIVMVALTSGIGLTFRKYTVSDPELISLSAYLYTNLILAFLVSGISIGILLLYSASNVSIPTTLMYLAAIYAFLGALDFNFHQGLIAYGLFKIASILDLLTIVIQISVFFLFSLSNQVSIAASLFTSLIISYITSVVSSALILLVHTNASINPSWKEIKLLIKTSTPFHIVGIAGGFADRIDRIVIAWFLPLGVLGKYAVGTSLLTYLRFLPEAFSRLIVSGQSSFSLSTYKLIGKSWFARLIFGVFISSVFAGFSQILVVVVLGKEWLVPFVVLLGFSTQELIRGYFQIRISALVAEGRENDVAKLSLLLIACSTIFSLIGVKLAGLIGVPIGIAVTYLILLIFSYKKLNGIAK